MQLSIKSANQTCDCYTPHDVMFSDNDVYCSISRFTFDNSRKRR
jgi:hypothetical protein